MQLAPTPGDDLTQQQVLYVWLVCICIRMIIGTSCQVRDFPPFVNFENDTVSSSWIRTIHLLSFIVLQCLLVLLLITGKSVCVLFYNAHIL